jgi:hypothetical protein
MRSSKSRSRSKSNRQRSLGNIVNRVFDSSGPESKVRGTPQQIIDKYLMLARDSQLSNDRVAEQNFLQHAEHYTRMLSEAQREMQREQENRQQNPNGGYEGGAQNGTTGHQGGYTQLGGDDRGGDRGGERNGDRQQQNRRRHEDQRGERGDRGGDEYRRSPAPQEERSDDEGPGLVETPEARLAATPTSSMMPDLSQTAAAPAPGGDAEATEARKPAQRRPRKPRAKAEDGEPTTPIATND